MATDHPRARTHVMPPKVIGLGAPVSVWIYFEVSEIPALIEAIGDELARRGCTPQTDGHTTQPETDIDPADRGDHIGALLRMLADVQRADATYAHGRFDVVWPTVLAHGVVHGAVPHAKRRADNAASGGGRRARRRARKALAAALHSRRDFDAVDKGGPDAVWL